MAGCCVRGAAGNAVDDNVAVSTEVLNRQPGESLEEIAASRIRSNGLYAYTAINAPRGLDERIYHVWQKDGQEASIALPWTSTAGARKAIVPGPTSRTSRPTRWANGKSGC